MALLKRDQILAATDRPTEEVDVPEWGGSVLVMGLTGRGRDEYFATLTKQRPMGGGRIQSFMDNENATAKLVARCIVDPETKEPMFTQQDVHALGEMDGAALDRVFTVAQRLSGLSDEDLADLGKDSASTLNGSSTSEPPSPSAARSKNSSPGSRPSS
jgi:hypothetical protein